MQLEQHCKLGDAPYTDPPVLHPRFLHPSPPTTKPSYTSYIQTLPLMPPQLPLRPPRKPSTATHTNPHPHPHPQPSPITLTLTLTHTPSPSPQRPRQQSMVRGLVRKTFRSLTRHSTRRAFTTSSPKRSIDMCTFHTLSKDRHRDPPL